MKYLKIYIIELILFISIIVFKVVLNNDLLLDLSIVGISFASIFLLGMPKDNSFVKGYVVRVVISCLLSFFLITYFLGLFLGFNRTVASLNIIKILRYVVLEFLVILGEEVIRYIIAKKIMKDFKPLIVYAAIMCFLNIIIEINGYNISTAEGLFIFFSVVIVPVISREFICSFLVYKAGLLPSALFKSVIILYEVVLPIIPILGDYLYSVSNVLLVYVMYLLCNKTILRAEKADKFVRKASYGVVYYPILIVLIIIVSLISGITGYKLIAIGSNSMVPIYSKGDAIIYQKVDIDDLKVGDIIAFQKNKVIVTHRIAIIEDNFIKTKGDANNSVDPFDLTGREVLGKVIFRIKYIGYPTIWINEAFEGRAD